MTNLNLSIVVPLFNEAENVRPLHSAIHDVVTTLGRTYEVIFIDDGSTDETLINLRQLQLEDPAIRVVRFRRNFGQTPAMRAGIKAARGHIIITMDGDLQNDPRDIPKLVEGIDQGSDLVLGWRKNRRDPLLSRTLPSRMANAMIGQITGINIHDSGCSLKAYRSDMIKRLPLYSEMHRFIPAISTLQGAIISEVIVRHFPRQRGKSKYGISRVGKVLLDVVGIKMLISFRHQPLRYFTYLATPFFLLATVIGGIDLFHRLAGTHVVYLVPAITSLLFFYLSVHLFFVGLLAELIVRSGIQSHSHLKSTVEHVN